MYYSTMVDAMINNRVNYLQRVLIIETLGSRRAVVLVVSSLHCLLVCFTCRYEKRLF